MTTIDTKKTTSGRHKASKWVVGIVLIILLIASLASKPAEATVTDNTPIIEQADKILASQHPGGAIAMASQAYSSSPSSSPIWINPYFANFSAIALINAYQKTSDTRYLNAVQNYINWYVNNINIDGTIYDFTGYWSYPTPTYGYDSSDSYAATFLVVLDKYYKIRPDNIWLNGISPKVQKIAAAMDLTLDYNDGLTNATPTYPVKYLMDNSEVRLGFYAGSNLAKILGNPTVSFNETYFAQRLEKNKTGLGPYWNSGQAAYNWAKHTSGSYDIYDPTIWSTSGKANAMFLSFTLNSNDTNAKTLTDKIYATYYNPASPPSDLRSYFFLGTAMQKFGRAEEAKSITNALYANLNMSYTYSLHRAYYIILNSTELNLDIFNSPSQITMLSEATADTTAPTIGIVRPQSNATVSGIVDIAAAASDNTGIQKVEFYIDNTLIATKTSPGTDGNYAVGWNSASVTNSSHIIKVKAFDTSGLTVEKSISITVSNVTNVIKARRKR